MLTRSNVPSQFVKKNNLFFLMGPPRLAPSMFRVPFGLSLTPARFSSQVNARSALLSCMANALPRNWLVPDFVMTVTAAPPVMPCSASKLLVAMLTSWMLSTGGDVHRVVGHRDEDVGRPVDAGVVGAALLAVDVGRQRASRRIGDGVLIAPGVAPGTRLISVWKLR